MTRLRDALLLAVVALGASCHSCRHRDHEANEVEDRDDDESEKEEERNARRLNYWRVQVAIVGNGDVATVVPAIDCKSDGKHQVGACGPKLFAFDELQPPLLRGTGAPGWKLARWESQMLQGDGRRMNRDGPMPDGRWYLNGFGYRDTGALETVTAVFVPVGSGADDVTSNEKTK